MSGAGKTVWLRGALAAACLMVLGLTAAGPALGVSVSFGTPSATSVFGKGITFKQPYSGAASFKEVDIVITYPASLGPTVVKVEQPGPGTFTYELETSKGQLSANTRLTARFQVVFADGTIQKGPDVAVTYADTRFKWKTKSGPVVRLHWYSGSDAFGDQLLGYAQDGVDKATEFMGTRDTAPIDFFVYADQEPFYDAMGGGIRENVGGLAIHATRTLFALAGPGDTAFAQSAVPHEITHIAFHEATENPYHSPPHWLNEAIATYVAQGYDSSDRSLVSSAVKKGTLMPLAALVGQFPTSREMFFLAYAESVSALDFMIKTYGREALTKLLAAFKAGSSDDEAFTAATGVDMAAFDGAWMASVGAKPVVSFGPQPAPTGPLPPGWVGADGVVATPAVSPGASISAGPTEAPGGSSGESSGIPVPALLVGVLALGVGAAVLAVVVIKRTRPAPPA